MTNHKSLRQAWADSSHILRRLSLPAAPAEDAETVNEIIVANDGYLELVQQSRSERWLGRTPGRG